MTGVQTCALPIWYSFDSSKAHASYNPGPYINAEADELVKQAKSVNDRAERTELYHQLLELALSDHPGLWFADMYPCWGVRKGVHMTDFDNWFMLCSGDTYNAWKE